MKPDHDTHLKTMGISCGSLVSPGPTGFVNGPPGGSAFPFRALQLQCSLGLFRIRKPLRVRRSGLYRMN